MKTQGENEKKKKGIQGETNCQPCFLKWTTHLTNYLQFS